MNKTQPILNEQEKQEEKEFKERPLFVDMRIQLIVDLILDDPKFVTQNRSHAFRQKIREVFAEQKIIVSNRTIDRYIKEAKKEIRQLASDKAKEKLRKHLLNRWSLINRARKAKNLKEERLTLEDIANLEGLYPDKSVKVKSEIRLKDINFSSMTSDQRTKLKALLKSGMLLNDALLHIGVIIQK